MHRVPHRTPARPAVLVTSTTEPPTGLGFAGGNLQNASMLMVQSGVDMFMKVGRGIDRCGIQDGGFQTCAANKTGAMSASKLNPPPSFGSMR